MYDPRRGDYVCLSQRTPLVRYLELPERVETLSVEPPLRILGMVASPSDLPPLDTGRERERMELALGPLQARGRVEVDWLEGQTWEALQEAMWDGPWHAFHFVGHGDFDPATGSGYLALAGEGGGTARLSATALGRLLNDHVPLRLAVLNACEGARGSGRDVFSGTAATLIRAGLPAVVAMQYPITDRAAVEFARAFYRALAAAQPVDAAVSAARQAVSQQAPAGLEWATPVLYLRALDAVLFSVTQAVGDGGLTTRPAPTAPPALAGPEVAAAPAAPAIAPADRAPARRRGGPWWLWLGAGAAAALLLVLGVEQYRGTRPVSPGASCTATGERVTDYAGRRLATYSCTTYAGSPVYANVQAGQSEPLDDSGYMDRAGRVWVVCQYQGRANPVIGGNANTWWLYTQGDSARQNAYGYAAEWGYLPATAVAQGGQDEPVPGVPHCPQYY